MSLNVTQPGVAALTTTSVSNAFNQLSSSTRNGGGLPSLSTAYIYDANGNLTTETAGSAVSTYTWDADNRLRNVTQPSLVSLYEYDANGLRTKKVEGTTETRFLLDGVEVLTEFDSSNASTKRYLQNQEAIDDILQFTEAGTASFPLTDALGSVIAITNTSGSVISRNTYEVYGARTTSGTGPQWAFGFTGREQDTFGGRYHRDRYANPNTGAWSQVDRMGPIDGPSLYLFARNNPVHYRDPSGMIGFGIDAFFYADRELVMWGSLFGDEFLAMFIEYTHGRIQQAFAVNECNEVLAADRHAYWLTIDEPRGNLLKYRIPQYLAYSLMGLGDLVHFEQIANRQRAIMLDAAAMAIARTMGYRAMIAVYVMVAEFPIPFPTVL